jgi:hypothetical protein
MTSKLNVILRRAVENALQGNLSFEQAKKLIEDWPAHAQRELREKSDALLVLSALLGDRKTRLPDCSDHS